MITRLVFYFSIFLQFLFSSGTMANISTACLGSPGISCAEHRLICTESLTVSITNITFGYRQGCSFSGVASCVNTTCCREETGDCFTPYNQTLLSQLQQTCSGRSTCTLNRNNGLDERSSYCFNGIPIHQSYSKIEYQCITNTTPQPTTETTPSTTTKTISNTIASNQASTDLANTEGLVLATETERGIDTDLGGKVDIGDIVGGIVGVILVIAIVGAVVFVFKRRLKKGKSQTEHQYDSASSRISNQPTPVDDSLNTRSQTDERTQYINEQQLSATTNGQSPTNYVTQDYEHAYDSAPSGTTDGPKAIYDSLNTREQTGYYNMGNINTTDDSQLSNTNNGPTPINTNNPDYEHAYSALDHDANKPKAVYDSLNTREQTGYYNMGSINNTGDSQQPGTVNRTKAQFLLH